MSIVVDEGKTAKVTITIPKEDYFKTTTKERAKLCSDVSEAVRKIYKLPTTTTLIQQ